ncbi:hypothetical protein [Mycobacterium malmoense]|uniref:hypothetical protein n=1 Tax=Mycobacterium malmoense TaxID=1780 RepID=UPI00114D4DAA|nr:hypothetical protein [Mycobacterium malmoense]
MSSGRPPAPIWQDPASGMAVWVNGGMVKINYGCLTPDEAAALSVAFAAAIEEACAWAARFDIHTRSYREEEPL